MSISKALLQTQPPGCPFISHSRSMTTNSTGRQTAIEGKLIRNERMKVIVCKQSIVLCH